MSNVNYLRSMAMLARYASGIFLFWHVKHMVVSVIRTCQVWLHYNVYQEKRSWNQTGSHKVLNFCDFLFASMSVEAIASD